MLRPHIAVAVLAASFAVATPAVSQNVVGRFATRETIDVQTAQSQYAEILSRVARVAGAQPLERCQFRGSSQACFNVPEVGVVFAPHFPAAVSATARASLRDEYLDLLLQRDSPLVDQVGWAPAAQVRNAHALLADYEQRARSHASFGCRGGECIAIVELLTNERETGARVLGACRIIRIQGRVGPPEFCEAISLQLGADLWLKAIVADIPEGGQGQPDFAINAIGPPNANFAASRDAIRQAITSSPIQLTVQGAPFGLLGVSDRRTSIVDRDFREMLTVRIDWIEADMFSVQFGRLRLAKAMVSTTIYVNRLNTSDAEDWHLPSPEQEQRYRQMLTTAVKSALLSRCTTPTWLDSFTVTCGLNVPPGSRITLP